MKSGRKLIKYPYLGKPCVRPLGSSWGGDPDRPEAAIRRPQMINDVLFSVPQQLHPEEAEALMGMEPGTTAGPGVTNLMQMKRNGGGSDINISKVILRNLLPRTLEAHVDVYLAQLDHQGLTREEITGGNEMLMLMNNQPDEFEKRINDLSSMRLQGYCIALGTHCNVTCVSSVRLK